MTTTTTGNAFDKNAWRISLAYFFQRNPDLKISLDPGRDPKELIEERCVRYYVNSTGDPNDMQDRGDRISKEFPGARLDRVYGLRDSSSSSTTKPRSTGQTYYVDIPFDIVSMLRRRYLLRVDFVLFCLFCIATVVFFCLLANHLYDYQHPLSELKNSLVNFPHLLLSSSSSSSPPPPPPH